jgi:hypothetical protein
MYNSSKFWASHRFMSPEAREKVIHHCGDCRFFICIQGVWEQRKGCVAGVRKYRNLRYRVPAVIRVMELLRSEGGTGWPGSWREVTRMRRHAGCGRRGKGKSPGYESEALKRN